MRYIKTYSILEVDGDKDMQQMMEAVEQCMEEHGEQYGITGAKVTALSKSTREEFNE